MTIPIKVNCKNPFCKLATVLFPKLFVCKQDPVTPTFKAIFDHQEYRANYKGCALLSTSWGLFASVYDFIGRRSSDLMLNWSNKYLGSQETIGQGREIYRKVYFPTENGKGLCFDGSGVIEVCSLRHSSTVLDYRGQPCFVSSEEDGEWLINADMGNKVLKLAVAPKVGIPLSSAKLPNSEEWIIVLGDNNGNETLVTTDGVVKSLPLATQVENWDGTIIAAGNHGSLYKVDVKTWNLTEYHKTGSQVVTHLWYDADNKILWVSCSGPDKLMYIDASGKVTTVIECSENDSPAVFDSRVTTGWWYRALGSRAQWYRIEKSSSPVPPPPPFAYEYVEGDVRDKGGEVWNPSFNGMDIRLSLNDVEHLNSAGIPAKGKWMPLNSAAIGGATLRVADDGGIIATGVDEVSRITGKRLHLCGFKVQSVSNPLVPGFSVHVPKDECKKTLRFLYATVAKLPNES